jgi:hypothetical protein
MTVTHHSNRSVNFASLLSKKSETPLWVLRFMDESPLLNSDRPMIERSRRFRNHQIMSQFFPCPYLNSHVELTEEREQHIIENHPKTLPDHLSQLIETIDNPDQVRQSPLDASALLFSKWFSSIRSGRYFIVVIVTDAVVQRHWIITAYTARKLAGGNQK